MATVAELQRERKTYLRQARRLQRQADTAIERLERKLFQLLRRKTLITGEDAMKIVPLYEDFLQKVRIMEKGLADFIGICTY